LAEDNNVDLCVADVCSPLLLVELFDNAEEASEG
jgi:hypothetical protein